MKKISLGLIGVFILVGGALASKDGGHHAPIQGSKELQQMKSLAGVWKGSDSNNKEGDPMTVVYEITSNGAAVMERLFPGTSHEMLSVYYDRDGKLTMTHYCGLGNRPEMSLTSSKKDRLDLEFIPSAGIDPAKDMYMHAVSLSFPDKNHLVHEWQSHEMGKASEKSTFKFERVK